MGKSRALEAERGTIEARVREGGGESFWLDLRSYGSEDRLIRDLFQSPTFLSWLEGTHHLHLFLDSTDECLIRMETLASLLVDELNKYPVQRLHLRIVCRPAEWPTLLEEGLIKLWGQESVKFYKLAPLQLEDVLLAAAAEGLDPAAFAGEVNRMEVRPFAAKPVTLKMLLEIYSRHERLPQTQTQLYEEGCLSLCEESNPSYVASRRAGDLTAAQRMAVAARIAAVMTFAKRSAVRTGVGAGELLPEDIAIEELAGSYEEASTELFDVTQAAVKEALNTGLFAARGPDRIGWAHQTYNEFLAAWYLTRRLNATQALSLIVHPGDPEGRLVPQLHEVAAWIAANNSEVFEAVMKADPEVLLRSDVTAYDEELKEALVAELLKLYDEERGYVGWLSNSRYDRLEHPRLADQLRPYIRDGTKNYMVRSVAIQIAESCKLSAVEGDLADVALDSSQSVDIRAWAARAVSQVGEDETKLRLRPLAEAGIAEDPGHRLKGWGLRALWPGLITSQELFQMLTPMGVNSTGSYGHFVSNDIVQHLRPEDLPAALTWVSEQGDNRRLGFYFKRLTDSIMLSGWEYLDTPGVLEAFAQAALSRLRQHNHMVGDHQERSRFEESMRAEDDKRQRLLEALLELIADTQQIRFLLSYTSSTLVLSKDLPWMLDRFEAAGSEQARDAWAQVIEAAFARGGGEHYDLVLAAYQRNAALAARLRWAFEIVTLGSAEAQQMKEQHAMMYGLEENGEEAAEDEAVVGPSVHERIAQFLDQCQSGDADAWWRLNHVMTFEPDGTQTVNEWESDLTASPGWRISDDTTRARIVEAAKRYVVEQDPQTGEWLESGTMYRPAYAGYRALRLLLDKDLNFITELTPAVWRKWASIVLLYPPNYSSQEELEPHLRLVELAYRNAPDEIIRILLGQIDRENSAGRYASIPDKVERCWDERFGAALLEKARATEISSGSLGNILKDLLKHRVEGAREFAQSLISSPIPESGEPRAKAVVAARTLLRYTEDADWNTVWTAIQGNPEFGREVISGVATIFSGQEADKRIAEKLTADQLADLYIWMGNQYPHAEDPDIEGVHSIGERETIARWRESLLNRLVSRGTPDSCAAVEKIIAEFPTLTYLKYKLQDARELIRRLTWTPPAPTDIMKLTNDPQRRLVQSGEQLLDAIIESLKRLEARLQDETPAAVDLWNENSSSENRGYVYRPKDENRFSDYVKRHLDDDLRRSGVVVNREVEIRRGTGAGAGERTDILVDAIIRNQRGEAYDIITAVVEAKGCWHRDLDTAMEEQLVNRYLRENSSKYGLYLIGWFNCDQWDNEDYRKQRAPGLTIAEAQSRFDVQAAALSSSDLKIKTLVLNTSLR
jgi:predicted NACHT family NTPase